MIKVIKKLETIVLLQVICHLKFNLFNEIPVVLHNGSNYDYYFTINKLANEFEGQFLCLRKIHKSTKISLF